IKWPALMLPCALRTWRPYPKSREAIIVKRTCVTFITAFFFSIGLIGASPIAQAQSGIASVYSGGRTASGERASASGMTAAHRTLPFGPIVRGRVIDVTPAAARALGFSGLAPVTLDVIDRRG